MTKNNWDIIPQIDKFDVVDEESCLFYDGYISGWLEYKQEVYFFSWIDEKEDGTRIIGVFDLNKVFKNKYSDNYTLVTGEDITKLIENSELKYVWYH